MWVQPTIWFYHLKQHSRINYELENPRDNNSTKEDEWGTFILSEFSFVVCFMTLFTDER